MLEKRELGSFCTLY